MDHVCSLLLSKQMQHSSLWLSFTRIGIGIATEIVIGMAIGMTTDIGLGSTA